MNIKDKKNDRREGNKEWHIIKIIKDTYVTRETDIRSESSSKEEKEKKKRNLQRLKEKGGEEAL